MLDLMIKKKNNSTTQKEIGENTKICPSYFVFK
jgi:hypothetical protein